MRLFTAILALLCGLGFASSASADFLIDDFSLPTGLNNPPPIGLVVTAGSTFDETTAAEAAAAGLSAVGGNRYVSLTWAGGVADAGNATIAQSGPPAAPTRLAISSVDQAQYLAAILYDAAGVGLGAPGVGVDLTGGGLADGTGGSFVHFVVDILSVDLGDGAVTVLLKDWDDDASSTALTGLTVGSNATLLSLFDNVGAGAGQVDLTKIKSIEILVNNIGQLDKDIVFTRIYTAAVPEPTSLAILGLGGLLAGFGVARRQRKQAAELTA